MIFTLKKVIIGSCEAVEKTEELSEGIWCILPWNFVAKSNYNNEFCSDGEAEGIAPEMSSGDSYLEPFQGIYQAYS